MRLKPMRESSFKGTIVLGAIGNPNKKNKCGQSMRIWSGGVIHGYFNRDHFAVGGFHTEVNNTANGVGFCRNGLVLGSV